MPSLFLLLSFPTEGALEVTGPRRLEVQTARVGGAPPRQALLALSSIARSVSHVPLPPCLWSCKLHVYSGVSPSGIEVAGRKRQHNTSHHALTQELGRGHTTQAKRGQRPSSFPGTCLQCTETRISIFQSEYQPWLTWKGCYGGTPEPGHLELRDGSINGQLWPPSNLHRVLLE